MFGCASPAPINSNSTIPSSSSPAAVDDSILESGAVLLTAKSLKIGEATTELATISDAFPAVISHIAQSEYSDIILFAQTREEAQQLLLVMQKDTAFMQLANGLPWRGSLRVAIQDPVTREISDLFVVRPTDTPVSVLFLDTTEAAVPNTVFYMRQSMVDRRVVSYVYKTTSPVEIDAYMIARDVLQMPSYMVIQTSEGVVFDQIGVSFSYHQLSWGWVDTDPSLQSAQKLLYELAKQNIEVPAPYLSRIRLLPDRTILMDLSGAQKVTSVDVAAMNTTFLEEWRVFMYSRGEYIQRIHQMVWAENPYMDVIGPMQDMSKASVVIPERLTASRMIGIEVPAIGADAAVTTAITELEGAPAMSQAAITNIATKLTVGDVVWIGINYVGWIIIVNQLGEILFRFGPNIEVPVVEVSHDQRISDAIAVTYTLGEAGGANLPAWWLTMASDDENPEMLPNLSRIWDEANMQLSLGEPMSGYLYLDRFSETEPGTAKNVALAWSAQGQKDAPVSITLTVVETNESLRFDFVNGTWVPAQAPDARLYMPLDTEAFAQFGVLCFEVVSVDSQLRIHFSPVCSMP